ncbi:hypothetical protein [Tautonia marina]|uniref:hypothetical protein n=1 Tax=Tautonia marina TaxID=2653855 RepID=UPI00126043DD|nr:hypothetical protein [Tautonia marina]
MTERHPRRGNERKTRRRSAPVALESLEGRQLLAYTPLGFSIPDLAIADAYTGPVGAYGGPISVTVEVSNLGQSSIPEPLAQFPGSASTADAGPTEIAVYFNSRGHGPARNRVLLGTLDVPAIPQNRLAQVTGTFTLPDMPPMGFPGLGQTGFITLELDPDRLIRDLDRTNNVLRQAETFQIVPNQPQLQAIALGLPPVMNPGDTIVPQVKVANYGAAPSNVEGPAIVQVVASQDTTFSPDDIVLGTFTVDNILPLSQAPTKNFVPGDVNLVDPPNVVLLDAVLPVALPETGAPYYVGVVIEPVATMEVAQASHHGDGVRLQLPQMVADSGLGLPPAGVVGLPSPPDRPFPFPPFDTPTGTPTPFPTDGSPDPIELRQALRRVPNFERPVNRFPNRESIAPIGAARPRPVDLAARLAARQALRDSLGRR